MKHTAQGQSHMLHIQGNVNDRVKIRVSEDFLL